MYIDGTFLWQLFMGATAITGIAAFIYAVYRVAKRVEQAVGVDKQGRTLSERMDKVEHQLWENGGSSLADRVNRIELTSAATAAEVTIVKDILLAQTTKSNNKKSRKK